MRSSPRVLSRGLPLVAAVGVGVGVAALDPTFGWWQTTHPKVPTVEPPPPVEPPTGLAREYRWLCDQLGHGLQPNWEPLVSRGEELFPLYERILTDPWCEDSTACFVFAVVERVEADRTRFAPYALRLLASPHSYARANALRVLAVTGVSDTAPVRPLLVDFRRETRTTAVRLMRDFGGPDDVAAMDAVLRDPEKYKDEDGKRLFADFDLQELEACRYVLDKELKAKTEMKEAETKDGDKKK